MKVDTQLIGAAGEHLVLSRLLSKGILAAQAPRGVRKVDLLVSHLDGRAPCQIQVKTRSGSGNFGAWPMNKKHEEIIDKDLFYCFVDLGESNPLIYIIPAKIVALVVRESHQMWLKTPGKKGQQHSDTDMRQIKLNPGQNLKSAPDGWMEKYLENWEIIS